MERSTRRTFLRFGAGAGLTGLTGCQYLTGSPPKVSNEATEWPVNDDDEPIEEVEETPAVEDSDAPVDVRGALYLPARAWNTYQMWANYDREVTERDLGYASGVNLNAIRTWLNYEFWEEAPERHERRFEHLLSAADDENIKVLVTLFEGVGQEPTEDNLHNTDPMTATTVASPSKEIIANEDKWGGPREFVRWAFERWGDDDRLLGAEVMNEPGWSEDNTRFSRGMFETMKSQNGSVPLSVGSTSVANDLDYAHWGADILQFHYNFPTSQEVFRDALRQVRTIAERVDQPVWLTEWQRVRSGKGFESAPAPDERTSNYSSMAPLIQDFGVGNFFWSLMVKPAVNQSQRKHGILNGLFHEDGAVWSLDDARAIKAMSGDPEFDGEERQEWPEWAAVIEENTGQS